MKTCNTCMLSEPVVKFMEYRRKCQSCRGAKRREFYRMNAEAIRARNMEWKRSNAIPQKSVLLNSRFKHRYGITTEQYQAMFEDQNGRCLICKTTDPGRRGSVLLSVDHCHGTGKVRGLLCSKCNSGLGYFRDNLELLQAAVQYLKNS